MQNGGNLIIVSNRVERPKAAASAGGLAVALGDVLRKRGGTWFGWSGTTVENDQAPQVHTEKSGNRNYITTDLTEKDVDDYYSGYSNRVLWPICHYRLDLSDYRSRFAEGYRRVNRYFADMVRRAVKPDDTIWIHDYHLIPLASELRTMGVENRIGFFLHIPLPPSQLLLAIPENRWLIRSLFAYDLIGFQTSIDVEHFIQYVVTHEGGHTHDERRIYCFGRSVSVDAFPASIDVKALQSSLNTKQAEQTVQRLRQRNLGRINVIGVDRLDYSKGLVHRLHAFRRLLENYPENRGNVTLTQVAPPSPENVEAYAEIRTELERLSGEINGEFGDFDWTPVRYIHRTVQRRTLAAIYTTSRVGLVTPLRDGMNLVAKEYVAVQDPQDPGVLVLSRFAGAAEEMQEAVIVNPYNIDAVAQSLELALRMPLAERRKRHDRLYERISSFDNRIWVSTFLDRLAETSQDLAA